MTDQLILNSVLVAIVGVLGALNAYFLKRALDDLKEVTRIIAKHGERLARLEAREGA